MLSGSPFKKHFQIWQNFQIPCVFPDRILLLQFSRFSRTLRALYYSKLVVKLGRRHTNSFVVNSAFLCNCARHSLNHEKIILCHEINHNFNKCNKTLFLQVYWQFIIETCIEMHHSNVFSRKFYRRTFVKRDIQLTRFIADGRAVNISFIHSHTQC